MSRVEPEPDPEVVELVSVNVMLGFRDRREVRKESFTR